MRKIDTVPEVSVIIPVLNEEATISDLHQRISAVLQKYFQQKYEIIFIDDGSTDSSWTIINSLTNGDARVRGIKLRRNFGKASALSVGVDLVRSEIIITMDADLQDDPEEIPRFLKALENGPDLVSGWKKNRKDPLSKRLPSKLFNIIVNATSGLKLHDFNCGFKAGRTEVYRSIPLYGELHRFIPVLAHSLGYQVGEIIVQHHPRRHGKSKFGIERLTRGALDILTVLTITRYGWRPGHLFGGTGMIMGVIGFLMLTYLSWIKVFEGENIGHRPLLMLGIMLVILAVQLLSFGMLSEIIISRTENRQDRNLISIDTNTFKPRQ